MARVEINVAGVTRPHPGETLNGDAWLVTRDQRGGRIAVIDALGHGPEAFKVARIAVEALEAHPDAGATESLLRCHRALAGTRGAAIAVAWIDAAGMRLSYAGLGNIEAQVWHGDRTERPISFRGIVGATPRTPRAFEIALTPDWLLVMHSDGVSARFDLAGLLQEHGRDQRAIAGAILARHARQQDDATVVVACPSMV